MDIQLNIQPNIVFAIIGALVFWQTMKLTYKHRQDKTRWQEIKTNFLDENIFKPRESMNSSANWDK